MPEQNGVKKPLVDLWWAQIKASYKDQRCETNDYLYHEFRQQNNERRIRRLSPTSVRTDVRYQHTLSIRAVANERRRHAFAHYIACSRCACVHTLCSRRLSDVNRDPPLGSLALEPMITSLVSDQFSLMFSWEDGRRERICTLCSRRWAEKSGVLISSDCESTKWLWNCNANAYIAKTQKAKFKWKCRNPLLFTIGILK